MAIKKIQSSGISKKEVKDTIKAEREKPRSLATLEKRLEVLEKYLKVGA